VNIFFAYIHSENMSYANDYNPANYRAVLEQEKASERNYVTDPKAFMQLIDVNEGLVGSVAIRATEKLTVVEGSQLVPVSLTLAPIPTTFSSSNNEVTYILKGGQGYGYIKDLYLSLQLTNGAANDVCLPALPYLFNRIEIWARDGQIKLQTLYPETMMQYFISYFTDSQKEKLIKLLNWQDTNYQREYVFKQNESVKFLLPLWGNWIGASGGIYFPAMKEEIWVKFFPVADPRIYTAGYTGSIPTINQMYLTLHEEILPPSDEKAWADLYTGTLEKNYLDHQRYTNTLTFTPGTALTVQLNPFRGKSPYWIMGLRSNPSDFIGGGYKKFKTLGPDATWQFNNATGTIISGNVAYNIEWDRYISGAEYFPGDYSLKCPGLYLHPWGDPMAAEQSLMRKGWFPFTGNEYLQINPGVQGATEVEATLTLSPAGGSFPTAGNYQIGVLGKITGNIQFNATATEIQKWVQALLDETIGMDGTPIICTATMSAAAGIADGNVVIKFSNLPRNYNKGAGVNYVNALKLQFVDNAMAKAVGCYVSCSVATGSAATGFGPAASYTLDIWAKIFRHCHIRGGRVQDYQPEPFG
jgi:hypothetical protein